MIDIRQLRENPERFRQGARDKNADAHIDRLLALDEARRGILQRLETKRAEQNRLSKEIGPQIGKLKGEQSYRHKLITKLAPMHTQVYKSIQKDSRYFSF